MTRTIQGEQDGHFNEWCQKHDLVVPKVFDNFTWINVAQRYVDTTGATCLALNASPYPPYPSCQDTV